VQPTARHRPWHSSAPGGMNRLLAGSVMLLLALCRPQAAHGQDAVSGRWLATVQDAASAPRVVFVLEEEGEVVTGRRILPGQEPLEVRGERRGQRVRLEFRVPEGRSAVDVVIEAEAFVGRMSGTWTAVLPTGQRIQRPWLAERTRSTRGSTR
jgi:hypothetical protein